MPVDQDDRHLVGRRCQDDDDAVSSRRDVNGGDLALAELEFLDHLAGKTFAQLPRHFQRRILETQVTAHLIQEGTPEPVRAAIARRIKTGRDA